MFKTPDEETEAVDGRRHVAAGGRAAKEIEGKPDTVAVMLKLMWKECKCYKKRCWQDPAKELTTRRPSRPRWSCRSCLYGIRSQAQLTSMTGYRREGGKGPGGNGEEPPKCRFYLTESGCRKGRSCDWSHDQTDGRRRCYACASPEHIWPQNVPEDLRIRRPHLLPDRGLPKPRTRRNRLWQMMDRVECQASR